MKLKNQVTSLELSKKLKKLGVKQESYFHHIKSVDEWEIENITMFERMDWEWGGCRRVKDLEHYSAFTVAELGEMLPSHIMSGIVQRLRLISNGTDFAVSYGTDGVVTQTNCLFKDKLEVNARAKMLIYLIENKLIKLNQSKNK